MKVPPPGGLGAALARLRAALERYERAEQVSRFLNLRCGAENEQVRYLELIAAAAPLGWSPRLTVTCLDWARATLRRASA